MRNKRTPTLGLKAKITRLNSMVSKGYEITKTGKLVHRQVCWKANGPFPRNWVVHHVDHDKKNNDPSNLVALPRELYDKLYKSMERNHVKFDRESIKRTLELWKSAKQRLDHKVTVEIVIKKSD
jgi:hypothetical protein